jgi:FADH2 O2-dependent halogenase
LLPSAAGVIDPLLSTGFPLTLLGIGRLARVLEETSPGAARAAALARYAQDTADELDATERLVAALYANMSDFPLFKRLAALYFAAASYAETVRRLGQPERARGFLLHAHPVFGPALRGITQRALTLPAGARDEARQRLIDDIAAAIAPFDVAGLGDPTRRDWYPVLASDLHAAHQRLGVSRAAIDALLAGCGFGNASADAPHVFAGQERA